MMGRAILTTDRFVAGQSDPIVATHTFYDGLGRVSETQRPSGVSITLAQDGTTGIYNVTGVDGAWVSASDSIGVWESSLSNPELPRTRTLYDGSGRVVETVSVDGLRSGTIYYENGQVHYSGTLKSAAAVGGGSTTTFATSDFDSYTGFKYDQGTSSSRYDEVIDALGHSTKTYKDELGRAVKTVFADSSFSETIYGFFADLPSAQKPSGITTAITYVKSIEQRASGSGATAAMMTIRYYDQAGRLVGVLQPDLDDDDDFGTGQQAVWRYTYDANGNQSAQIDPRSGITNSIWNPNGKTIQTTFEYDQLGRRIKRTLPDGQSETWTYELASSPTFPNRFDRLIAHTDFKGQTTAYAYDTGVHQGRVKKEYRFAAGVTALDANLAVQTANAAERTEYEFDDLGRRTTVDEFVGVTQTRHTTYAFAPVTGGQATIVSPEGTINHVYDPVSSRLTRTYTSNNDTSYGYDVQGRLYTVTVNKLNGTTLSTPLVTTYTYDVIGNLDTTVSDNGTTTTSDDLRHDYGYDPLNRLTGLTVTRGSTSLFTQTYTLATDVQRESTNETRGGVTTFTDWEYDAWNRLKSEYRDVGDESVGNTSGFNTPNGTGDYYATYTFDPVGNRLTKTVNDNDNSKDETITNRYVFASGDTIGGVAISSSLYGKVSGNDWLLGTTTTLGSGSTTRYEFDNNGSTIGTYTGSSSKKYTWDLRNRMSGYDADGNGNLTSTGDATFAYDNDGVRVKRAVAGGDTAEFLHDTNNPTGYSQVLEEQKNGTLDRSYIIGQSGLGQKDSNGKRLFVSDGHGSTRSLIDPASSTPVQNYDYDAYGNALWSGSSLTPILYTNELFDPIVDQYVLRARYYNQVLGAFSSFDAFEADHSTPDSLHKFIYARSNPVYFLDPSGFNSVAEQETNIGLMGLLANVILFTGLVGMAVSGGPVSQVSPELSVLADQLHVPVEPIEKAQQNRLRTPGLLFLHGTSVAAWGNSLGPSQENLRKVRETDFGLGFYTFDEQAERGNVYTSEQAAAERARSAASRGGTQPVVLEFYISEPAYDGLRPKTIFDPPSYRTAYQQTVNGYRFGSYPMTGGPLASSAVVIGPVATKQGDLWKANLDFPDQTKFRYPEASKLKLIRIYTVDNVVAI